MSEAITAAKATEEDFLESLIIKLYIILPNARKP